MVVVALPVQLHSGWVTLAEPAVLAKVETQVLGLVVYIGDKPVHSVGPRCVGHKQGVAPRSEVAIVVARTAVEPLEVVVSTQVVLRSFAVVVDSNWFDYWLAQME